VAVADISIPKTSISKIIHVFSPVDE